MRKEIRAEEMISEEVLADLMSDIDASLLNDNYLEEDLERKRLAWIKTFLREKNWKKEKDPREKKVFSWRSKEDESPLFYGWGEAVRTDMGGKLRTGMSNVKRKAAAFSGFMYGVLTMAVVAIGFFALAEKRRRIG